MKKQNLLLMCFSMLLGFTACGGNTDTSSNAISGSDEINDSSNNESSSLEGETSNNESSESHISMEDKEKRELFVCIPEDRSLKVAQFADIHFGIEGKDWHNDKVERTKQYMQAMVDELKGNKLLHFFFLNFFSLALV